MALATQKRLAWAITGSGHYLRESIILLKKYHNVDIFLSKAAAEIIKQYGFQEALDATNHRVYFDKTASSIPVELFYQGQYHTLVIAPATSNTVAKMAFGISDSLVTNLFAQAGKTHVPSIVFACDTSPELSSEAPRNNMVMVYPRKVDLVNVTNLAIFDDTQVVADINHLEAAINTRIHDLNLVVGNNG
jgi:flavoprotein